MCNSGSITIGAPEIKIKKNNSIFFCKRNSSGMNLPYIFVEQSSQNL